MTNQSDNWRCRPHSTSARWKVIIAFLNFGPKITSPRKCGWISKEEISKFKYQIDVNFWKSVPFWDSLLNAISQLSSVKRKIQINSSDNSKNPKVHWLPMTSMLQATTNGLKLNFGSGNRRAIPTWDAPTVKSKSFVPPNYFFLWPCHPLKSHQTIRDLWLTQKCLVHSGVKGWHAFYCVLRSTLLFAVSPISRRPVGSTSFIRSKTILWPSAHEWFLWIPSPGYSEKILDDIRDN